LNQQREQPMGQSLQWLIISPKLLPNAALNRAVYRWVRALMSRVLRVHQATAPGEIPGSDSGVLVGNSDSNVLVVEAAQDWH
jgi:hypothetical protein